MYNVWLRCVLDASLRWHLRVTPRPYMWMTWLRSSSASLGIMLRPYILCEMYANNGERNKKGPFALQRQDLSQSYYFNRYIKEINLCVRHQVGCCNQRLPMERHCMTTAQYRYL